MKLIWALIVQLSFITSGHCDSNGVSSITVVKNAGKVELSKPLRELNESPYFKSWTFPFESKIVATLIVNQIEDGTYPTVSVGVGRSTTPTDTNFIIILSTSAILRERKLMLYLDSTLVTLEATKDTTLRGKDDDMVLFNCDEALVREIARAKSVHVRMIRSNETGDEVTLDREFSTVNISRFKTFVDVVIDGKPLRGRRSPQPVPSPPILPSR